MTHDEFWSKTEPGEFHCIIITRTPAARAKSASETGAFHGIIQKAWGDEYLFQFYPVDPGEDDCKSIYYDEVEDVI